MVEDREGMDATCADDARRPAEAIVFWMAFLSSPGQANSVLGNSCIEARSLAPAEGRAAG